MTDDPKNIQMPPSDFDRLSFAIMRAHCLAERLRTNQATGLESASEIEQEAAAFAHRVNQVFVPTAEHPDREERARELGWPTADALMVFLFDGPSVGGVQ